MKKITQKNTTRTAAILAAGALLKTELLAEGRALVSMDMIPYSEKESEDAAVEADYQAWTKGNGDNRFAESYDAWVNEGKPTPALDQEHADTDISDSGDNDQEDAQEALHELEEEFKEELGAK